MNLEMNEDRNQIFKYCGIRVCENNSGNFPELFSEDNRNGNLRERLLGKKSG